MGWLASTKLFSFTIHSEDSLTVCGWEDSNFCTLYWDVLKYECCAIGLFDQPPQVCLGVNQCGLCLVKLRVLSTYSALSYLNTANKILGLPSTDTTSFQASPFPRSAFASPYCVSHQAIHPCRRTATTHVRQNSSHQPAIKCFAPPFTTALLVSHIRPCKLYLCTSLCSRVRHLLSATCSTKATPAPVLNFRSPMSTVLACATITFLSSF